MRADDITKRAKIEELLTAGRSEHLQSQMPALMHQLLVQAVPSMADNPMLQKLEQEIVGEAQAAVKWDVMNPTK